MRRHEHLRGAREQLLDQNALAVGFKAAFDLIDDHDRMLGMMGCGDLERRKPACPRTPARHGQHGAVLGCGEADQRIERKTRPADQTKAELAGQSALLEPLIEITERDLRTLLEFAMHVCFPDLIRQT